MTRRVVVFEYRTISLIFLYKILVLNTREVDDNFDHPLVFLGLNEIIELCAQFGSIQFDPSIGAMLKSGAEIDEQSLSGFKRLWRVPMCLKRLASTLAGYYFNSKSLAGAILAPLAARY